MIYRSTRRAKQENAGGADFAAIPAENDMGRSRESAASAHGLSYFYCDPLFVVAA
jgi:hypothetical protein